MILVTIVEFVCSERLGKKKAKKETKFIYKKK